MSHNVRNIALNNSALVDIREKPCADTLIDVLKAAFRELNVSYKDEQCGAEFCGDTCTPPVTITYFPDTQELCIQIGETQTCQVIDIAGSSLVLEDSTTIDLQGLGITGDPLIAEVIISPQPGNVLTVLSDGLYAQATSTQNGVNNSSGSVELGGILLHDTDINLDLHDFAIIGPSGLNTHFANDVTGFYANNISFSQFPDSRNDSVSFPPLSFFYPDASGNLKVAPFSAVNTPPDLQTVTDVGNTTTNSITAQNLIVKNLADAGVTATNRSLAMGSASTGTLLATGAGNIAGGSATSGGSLISGGNGTLALGFSGVNSTISSTGVGSVSVGQALATGSAINTGVGSGLFVNNDASAITNGGNASLIVADVQLGSNITNSGAGSVIISSSTLSQTTSNSGRNVLLVGHDLVNTQNDSYLFGHGYSNTAQPAFHVGYGFPNFTVTSSGNGFGGQINPQAQIHVRTFGTSNDQVIMDNGTTGNHYSLRQAVTGTSDAAPTLIQVVNTTINTTYLLKFNVIGNRTGGVAGAVGDVAIYEYVGRFKNVGGTVTLIAESLTISDESQPSWNLTSQISGTTINIFVTGASNNIIAWALTKGEVHSSGY